jgi:LPS export ABC transporter protein LptC
VKRARYGIAAFVGLAVLVTANWWLDRTFDPGAPPPPAIDGRTDYALVDFTATFFDADGVQTLSVSGPSMRHDARTRTATIASPTFALEPGVRDWTGRAQRGIVERDAERLTLIGDVHLARPDRRGRLEIASERIIYDSRANVARSPVPVRVEQAGDLVTGGSLEVWIDEQRMELTDDVHAIYRGAGAAADG